ncbi:MAG: cytidine deaminase [Bacteroidota bacterium]
MIDEKTLAEAARKTSLNAYAPYSKFRVGAAVLTDKGEMFTGCNVENATYGLASCAERNAIYNAVIHSGNDVKITKVVVYTPTDEPTSPCGICRQVIHEFGENVEVISVCDGPNQMRSTSNELLPKAFGPRDLL